MANIPFAFLHKSPIDFFDENCSVTFPVAVQTLVNEKQQKLIDEPLKNKMYE